MQNDVTPFIEVNDAIINDIKNELMLQGHHLTGALEASLKPEIVNDSNGFILTAEAAEYLQKLEKGIKPEDIVINSQTLAEMARYVELRMGLRGSQAMSVAYRILQKQKVEGNPTKSSYQFSQTGNRTKVVTNTFEKNDKKYFQMVDVKATNELDKTFFSPQNGTI